MAIRRTNIDLNLAPQKALSTLPLLSGGILEEVLHRRPFKSWEDFKQALGFDQDMIRLFRKAGATLTLGAKSLPVSGTRKRALVKSNSSRGQRSSRPLQAEKA